jgi:DNA-binding transcriptional ArsR family regulator
MATANVPHPLTDSLVELISERFRALSEPTRIRLLDRLRDGEATVGELTAATGATQQNVSKHLGVLTAAGILGRERDGNFVRYRIVDPTIFELCELVCGRLREQSAEFDRAVAGVAS